MHLQGAPVLRHVVLLTLVPDATAEQRHALLDDLASLPLQIPQIHCFAVGLDAGLSSANASLAVVADFKSESDYLEYAVHPEHLRVIEQRIKPVLALRVAVQHWLK